MKFLKLFTILLFAVTICNAQNIQLKTTSGSLFIYGTKATLTTTDSAYNTIATNTLATNTAGMIEVAVTGVNLSNGDAVTGSKIVRYNKASGTLTLGTPSDELTTVTSAGLGTATWDISTSGNNIIVRVKGKLGTTVKWRCLIKNI